MNGGHQSGASPRRVMSVFTDERLELHGLIESMDRRGLAEYGGMERLDDLHDERHLGRDVYDWGEHDSAGMPELRA